MELNITNMIRNIFTPAIFFLGLFISMDINSQWTKSELNGNLKNIIVCNEDTFALIGADGVIYLTEDQGKYWKDISLPSVEFVSDAQFIGRSKIYAATTEGLWLTTDYGMQWEAKDRFDNMAGLHFFNDTVGIIASSHNIFQLNLRTGVKDTLWSMEYQEFFDFGGFSSMIFPNDSIGFALGTIAKRINGLLGLYGIIIMTEDYGKNWQTIFDADSIEFLNAGGIYLKGNRLYAFENMNLIYTDTAVEPVWHNITFPSSYMIPRGSYMQGITSVFFTTKDTGYITLSPIALLIPIIGDGYDIILRTSDCGETWLEQIIDTTDLATTYANPSLSEIRFLNDSIGFSCGYDKLFYTANKGGSGITNTTENVQYNEASIEQVGDKLLITVNKIPQVIDFYLYDLIGILKIRITEDDLFTSTYTIDLQSLAAGLYVADIYIDKRQRFTKKLYISRR